MPIHDLVVSPEVGFNEEALEQHLRQNDLLPDQSFFQIRRRSVDARQKVIKVNMQVEVRDTPPEVEYVEDRKSVV